MTVRLCWHATPFAAVVALAWPLASDAQQDSARVRADTARATLRSVPVSPPRSAGQATARTRAPLTPKRAFLYSAVLPGFGQSRLDRGSSGALFASVELAALVMLRRSGADLREARRFRTDTLPANFAPRGDTVAASGTLVGRYTSDLVRTRRLHVEDWIAVVAFNHLFSGADAFVSAQLWDMPVQLTAIPGRVGPTIVASVAF
ncbi:MAG: hypothetical protein ACK54K_03920 [Gemmatimonadaceae bacterium]